METPSTSQKRKYNAYEEPHSESAADTEEEAGSRGGCSGSEYERTPTKRLKSSGTFEQIGKRKDNGNAQHESITRFEDRFDIKRRKI